MTIIEVLRLDKTGKEKLKNGANIICGQGVESKNSFIIYKNLDNVEQPYLACRNYCKHQGGRFALDIEDSCELKCSKHGWKLDVSTMTYTNPPNSFVQEQLALEEDEESEGLVLFENRPPQPWEFDVRKPRSIAKGEVTITYMTHACMELKFNGFTLFFDPWLTGPAFLRGWWLLHEPPADWLDRLAKADAIYISHLHSDHLSYETLEMLHKVNPDIPIYVGDLSTPVFLRASNHGMDGKLNVKVSKFDQWITLTEDLRFMILMDGVHPAMDTCILVDYKGHLILNTVDCTCPNGARLPKGVEIMMSDFAGGASGFPMTFFGGRYTEDWKRQFIKTERQKLLQYKASIVKEVHPKLYIPFAGYFVEAHKSDEYLRDLNLKNDPDDLCRLIRKQCGDEVNTWVPVPNRSIDLGLLLRNEPFSNDPENMEKSAYYKTNWKFSETEAKLVKCVPNRIFNTKNWAQFYFEWAGFSDYNLVLRIIETDDNFKPMSSSRKNDIIVDFGGPKPKILETLPSMKGRNFLEVKARIQCFRYTIVTGELWDGLYIGFQCQISRDPDTFHFKFWDHFQIGLPIEPPNWDKFLREQAVFDGSLYAPNVSVVSLGSKQPFFNRTLVSSVISSAAVLLFALFVLKKSEFIKSK